MYPGGSVSRGSALGGLHPGGLHLGGLHRGGLPGLRGLPGGVGRPLPPVNRKTHRCKTLPCYSLQTVIRHTPITTQRNKDTA